MNLLRQEDRHPLDAEVEEMLVGITLQELERDPYSFYEGIRRCGPVQYVAGIDSWLAIGFDEVREIHRDTERFETALPAAMSECLGEANILAVEGPRHRRYRQALQACLAPRVVMELTDEVIESTVEERLSALMSSREADLVAEYFEPISVLALGRLMGIPEIDADTLRRWFHGIILGSSNVENDRAVAEEANGISTEIDARLAEVFERIDAEPGDTIISHILRRAEGETLAERVADISPTLKVVIGGGLQEPGHGASTLAFALLSDLTLRDRFVSAPEDLVKPAVEEALRWVSPIQIDTRLTRHEVEIGGKVIPADTYVLASNGAANRDPTVFGEDAHLYDVDRGAPQHLGFGFGSHFCSGNAFGRVVMAIAARRLFEELPAIQMDPEKESAFRGFVFRAPASLHVRW